MSITRKGILWGYGVQTTQGSAAVASAGLRVRRDGLPDLKPNMTHVDQEIYDGYWGRRDYTEYAGIKRPGVTGFPSLLSVAAIQRWLQQVCDESGPDGGGNYTYTLKATGCAPSDTKFISLYRRNALATSKDKRIIDAVIKSVKINSSESQNAVHMDLDILASDIAYTGDYSGGTYTQPSDSFKLHKGLTFKIGATATKCPEYDLTLDWGTIGEIDNNDKPQSFLVGRFNASGTVRIPWADEDVLADYVTSVGNTLTWLWGTAGSSGYLEIIVPVKYTEPDEDTDNEERLRQGMPFRFMETGSQALQIKLKP